MNHEQSTAQAMRAAEERRELMRIAAVRALELDAQISHMSVDQRRAAMRAANAAPMKGPLSQGNPA